MIARILTGAVAACLAAAPAPAETVRGVTAAEIVLGSHQPLSGPAAAWGTQIADGLRMRFDEANEKGGIHGRKIRLVVEDSQFNPARAAQAANKLLNQDQVFAIIGALGTPTNMVVMQEALKLNVPNLFPNAAGKTMFDPFDKRKFALLSTHYQGMRAAIRYMVDKRGKRTVCAMVQDNAIGQEIVSGVGDQLKAMNLALAAEARHKPDDRDFTANMARLKAANCDLIVLGSVIADTIIPMATAKRMGWSVDFLGSSSSYSAETAELAKGATEGLFATTPIEIPYEGEGPAARPEWIKRYRAKFGSAPGVQAAAGYMDADLFLAAAERAGRNLTVDTLVAALESIKGYQDPLGVSPPITFSATQRLGTDRVFLFRIENGRWRRVDVDLNL